MKTALRNRLVHPRRRADALWEFRKWKRRGVSSARAYFAALQAHGRGPKVKWKASYFGGMIDTGLRWNSVPVHGAKVFGGAK